MGWRIGVDTGGTFTDVVLADPDGRFTLGKAPTTPGRIFGGVRAALENAAAEAGLPLARLLAESDVLIYGTTHATNAIVTGGVAKTALLVTHGFPDVLVLKEGGKSDPHDFSRPYPPPYVPRRHTFEIEERIDAEGAVVTALDETQAREVIETLGAHGFEAVAVALLWSIANPAHELRLGELLSQALPEVPVTLSHALNPILREYRRASSAAIDASIKPLMQAHLRAMQADLEHAGFAGELLVSTTLGGCAEVARLVERPIETVRSGPAMAPVAAQTYAGLEGDAPASMVLVADTGGTTFDVGLVLDGRIATTQETWLGGSWTGHMLGIPAVDVRSVGAGGGSIAWLDPGGLLRVGPQSAGAEPGPACYGRGGEAPTVTDAALLLGYLDPAYFLGGRMTLDEAAARRAMARVAEPLGLGIEEAAFSVLALANETMINAISEITVSEGLDPRDALLVAGGGAAGLSILPIARELGCQGVLLPRTASALSACGMQFSDIVAEERVSLPTRSRAFDAAAVNAALEKIDASLGRFAKRLGERGFTDHWITHSVDAHYASQVWELDVPLPVARFAREADADALFEAFHACHERVFSVRDPGSEIELTGWAGRVAVRLPHPLAKPDERPAARPEPARRRRAWFDTEGAREVPVWLGEAIPIEHPIEGPALIEEPTTTLVLHPGMRAVLSRSGSYRVDLGGEGT